MPFPSTSALAGRDSGQREALDILRAEGNRAQKETHMEEKTHTGV